CSETLLVIVKMTLLYFPYLSHTFPIPFPYLSHTLLILSSYSLHILLILSSYITHTLLIHSSFIFRYGLSRAPNTTDPGKTGFSSGMPIFQSARMGSDETGIGACGEHLPNMGVTYNVHVLSAILEYVALN